MADDKRLSSEEILEEIRQRRSEAIIEVDEQTRQFVIASVGSDLLGLPGSLIKEILPNSGITFVPGVPDHFLGVINVRGDLQSVVDVARVLGLSRFPNPKMERILITEVAGVSSGLLVDYVQDIVDIPVSKISDSIRHMEKARSNYFVGEFDFKSEPVVLLNVARLFEDLVGKRTE